MENVCEWVWHGLFAISQCVLRCTDSSTVYHWTEQFLLFIYLSVRLFCVRTPQSRQLDRLNLRLLLFLSSFFYFHLLFSAYNRSLHLFILLFWHSIRHSQLRTHKHTPTQVNVKWITLISITCPCTKKNVFKIYPLRYTNTQTRKQKAYSTTSLYWEWSSTKCDIVHNREEWMIERAREWQREREQTQTLAKQQQQQNCILDKFLHVCCLRPNSRNSNSMSPCGCTQATRR